MLCTEVFPLCDGVSLCDGWACLPFFKLPLLILTSLQNDHLIPLTPNRSTTPFKNRGHSMYFSLPTTVHTTFPIFSFRWNKEWEFSLGMVEWRWQSGISWRNWARKPCHAGPTCCTVDLFGRLVLWVLGKKVSLHTIRSQFRSWSKRYKLLCRPSFCI